MIDLTAKKVALDGKFAPLTRDEVELIVRAHGGEVSASGAHVLVTAAPGGDKAKKFRAANKQVVSVADFGNTCATWFERLKARVDVLGKGKDKAYLKNFAFGPPPDEATLYKIAEVVGFDLPEDFLALARTFDGLSFLYMRTAKIDVPKSEPIYWRFAHSEDPFWQQVGKNTVSCIALPRWEEMFMSHAAMFAFDMPADTEWKIGHLTLTAEDFKRRIFPFELYHSWTPTMLYADPTSRSFFVLHSHDHGADLDVSHPIPLWAYMEGLLDGRVAFGKAPQAPGTERYWRPLKKQLAGRRRWVNPAS